MDQDRIKSLVQQVVAAYLKTQLQEQKAQPISILLGYQSSNPTAVLEAVAPLLNEYEITLILSKQWLQDFTLLSDKSYIILEETSQEELLKLVDQSAMLVVPAVSYQMLSKLALTMDDEASVWMAIQYQLLGKPIIIAKDYVELNVYQQIHAPHSVKERIQSYIRQLQTDQVKWVALKKLAETVKEEYSNLGNKQTLILEKHIEKAYQDGLKEIKAAKNTKLTPAAKDLAKELKIVIQQTDSLKGGTS